MGDFEGLGGTWRDLGQWRNAHVIPAHFRAPETARGLKAIGFYFIVGPSQWQWPGVWAGGRPPTSGFSRGRSCFLRFSSGTAHVRRAEPMVVPVECVEKCRKESPTPTPHPPHVYSSPFKRRPGRGDSGHRVQGPRSVPPGNTLHTPTPLRRAPGFRLPGGRDGGLWLGPPGAIQAPRPRWPPGGGPNTFLWYLKGNDKGDSGSGTASGTAQTAAEPCPGTV